MNLRASVLILAMVASCMACAPRATPGSPLPAASSVSGGTATLAVLPEPAASASSTATHPALTPTLPPAPRSFTETFDTSDPHWSFLQIDNGQVLAAPGVHNGFLVFDLQGPNQWAYALYGGPIYADVRVEIAVQYRTAGDGAAGIVCRYDEKQGWYELNVYADQTYQLLFGQWLSTGLARYTPLYRGQSPAIQPDANVIALECQGNTLTPVVNGTQLRKWQELKFALLKGKIGLTASSFADAPFSAAVDLIKVSEP